MKEKFPPSHCPHHPDDSSPTLSLTLKEEYLRLKKKAEILEQICRMDREKKNPSKGDADE